MRLKLWEVEFQGEVHKCVGYDLEGMVRQLSMELSHGFTEEDFKQVPFPPEFFIYMG